MTSLEQKRWRALRAALSLALAASLGLAACQSVPIAPPVTVPVTVVMRETVPVTVDRVVTVQSVVTATPAATPAPPKRLTVCMLQEPSSLSLLVSNLPAVLAANQVLYDGPIDTRGYDYQAVAFTHLPSSATGDAGLDVVEVAVGDTVYDAATGQVVTLAPDSRVALFQPGGQVLQADFAAAPTAPTIVQWAEWTQVDGLSWEDGQPVSSADALLAYAVASSAFVPLRPEWVPFTAVYEAAGDRTIRWTGLPGYATPTPFLNHAGFLPAHVLSDLAPDQVLTDPRVVRAPLAYGPFKLDEWAPGDRMVFSRNPAYWRADEGLPRLDQVIIRFVPNSDQIVAQLAAGRCDLAPQESAFAEHLPLLRQMQAEGLLAVYLAPEPVFEQLSFNLLPAPDYPGFAGAVRATGGGPVLADARVRQAVAHCLDRQALVEQGLRGAGLVPLTYAPQSHPFAASVDQVTTYAFDPALGRALLEEAGWAATAPDGVRANAAGQRLSLQYSSRITARRQAYMPLVQRQLRDNCGIEVTIDLYGAEYTDPGPAGLALGRRFDLSQLTFNAGREPVCSLYISAAIPNAANGWDQLNLTGYSNPDFDAACQAAFRAADADEKAAWHTAAQRLWSADLPAIILFSPARLLLVRPIVLNVVADPTAGSDLWNVELIDLAD
jgi:peptide/nickel transport system substrate-binding protein